MKGLDPLIAEIMLIAIVVSVATIVFIFFSSFSTELTEKELKKSNEAKCFSNARIKIISVTENKITIINNGMLNLTNVTISADIGIVNKIDSISVNEIKVLDFYRLNNKSVTVSAFCDSFVVFYKCDINMDCWR